MLNFSKLLLNSIVKSIGLTCIFVVGLCGETKANPDNPPPAIYVCHW